MNLSNTSSRKLPELDKSNSPPSAEDNDHHKHKPAKKKKEKQVSNPMNAVNRSSRYLPALPSPSPTQASQFELSIIKEVESSTSKQTTTTSIDKKQPQTTKSKSKSFSYKKELETAALLNTNNSNNNNNDNDNSPDEQILNEQPPPSYLPELLTPSPSPVPKSLSEHNEVDNVYTLDNDSKSKQTNNENHHRGSLEALRFEREYNEWAVGKENNNNKSSSSMTLSVESQSQDTEIGRKEEKNDVIECNDEVTTDQSVVTPPSPKSKSVLTSISISEHEDDDIGGKSYCKQMRLCFEEKKSENNNISKIEYNVIFNVFEDDNNEEIRIEDIMINLNRKRRGNKNNINDDDDIKCLILKKGEIHRDKLFDNVLKFIFCDQNLQKIKIEKYKKLWNLAAIALWFRI